METRDTRPDTSKDELQRPDRAKYDELGRTGAVQPGRPSPREQPAKAVHPERHESDDVGPANPTNPSGPRPDDQDVGKGAVED